MSPNQILARGRAWALPTLAAILLASNAIAAYPTKIAIKGDAGGAAAGTTWPMGFGIPLKPGQVTNPVGLGLQAANGALVPAVFEPRTRWADGSVQWLWADVSAPVGTAFTMLATGQKAALPAPGVQVANTSTSVIVDAGKLRVTWQKTYAAPTAVALDNSAGSPVIVGTGDGKGVFLIDQANTSAFLGGSAGALVWKVETANALRAVIRVEGYYTSAAGVQLARGIVRYHLYWNQPWMEIENTFIVTRDNTQTSYREFGVRMPLSLTAAANASFGRKGTTPYSTSLASTADQGWVYQSSVPHFDNPTSRFAIGRGTSTLVTGVEAEGWGEVAGGNFGMMMQVRDFAQQFPIEISGGWKSMTAKLWSQRGGRRLDFKPATMVNDFWGQDWAGNVSTSPTNPWTWSELQAYNPSAVGAARSHTITVGYFHGASNATRTAQWARAFQTEPVLVPNPRWTVHVDPRVFSPMAAKGEGGTANAALDRATSIYFDEHMVGQRAFPYTGFYDWGKTPDLRYEKNSSGRVWAQFTRLNYTNPYQIVGDLMITFARTGERKYLDAASRYNRLLADFQIVHWGGGKENKLKGRFALNGAQNHPVYWSGSGIFYGHSSREHIQGFAYEYFLRDNRWLKDNIDLVTAAIAPYLKAQKAAAGTTRAGQQRAVYNAFRCEPFPGLNVLMSLYQATANADIKAFAQMQFNVTTNKANPGGIDAAYFTTYKCQAPGALYKPDRTAMAVIRYFDVFGDANAKVIGNLIARRAAVTDKTQPFSYQNLSGAYLARVYQWTRATDLLNLLNVQVNKAKAEIAAYERLAAGSKGYPHFLAAMHTIGHQDLNHWRYAFTGVSGFGTTPAVMDFSAPCNGPALIGLPTAAWALAGYPPGGAL